MNEIGNHLSSTLGTPANGAAVRTPLLTPSAPEQQTQLPPRKATSMGPELPSAWDVPVAHALAEINVAPSIQNPMMDFSNNLVLALNATQGDAYDVFSRLGSLQTAFGQAFSRNSDLLASPNLQAIA